MLKHEIHLVNGLSQKYVEKLSSYIKYYLP